MPVVVNQLAPLLRERTGRAPAEVEAALKLRELQSSLVWLTLLSKKYKELFGKFYLGQVGRSHTSAQRLGWLLFLLARRQLLPETPDIVR